MGCGLLFPGITCEVQKERQIFQKSPLSYSDHPDHTGNRTECHRNGNGYCQDQLLAVRIILVGIFSFKTVQYFLGNQSPALIHAIGILDDPEIPVYNENPATIAVGQLFQLAVHRLRAGVIQIILLDQQVAHDVTDVLHALHTVGNGTIFIVGNDHFRYDDTRYDSLYDQDDQNTKAETF